MRINAPVTHPQEVNILFELGADEFYCGVVEDNHFYNRRPTPQGNLNSFDELLEIVNMAHSLGLTVSFVLNETCYLEKDYPPLVIQAQKAIECGVDAFVAADPVLIDKLAGKFNQRIHLSTTGSAYNSEAVSFFQSLGVSRIILPRHLSLQEITLITTQCPEMEFETIVLGDPCRWEDGLCNFEHNLHLYSDLPEYRGGGCSKFYEVEPIESKKLSEKGTVPFSNCVLPPVGRCGLCALFDLKEAGIQVLKTTGRDNDLLRAHYLRYLSIAVELLNQPGLERDGFVIQTQELRARMISDFVAGHTLHLSRHTGDMALLGQEVSKITAESFLLECDPSYSCYFPEAFE